MNIRSDGTVVLNPETASEEEIIAALARILQGYDVERDREDWRECWLIRNDGKARITIRDKWVSKTAKSAGNRRLVVSVHVAGNAARYQWNYEAERRAKTEGAGRPSSITVSCAKRIEHIARDIQRRLLDPFEPWSRIVEEVAAEAEDYAKRTVAARASIVEAIGGARLATESETRFTVYSSKTEAGWYCDGDANPDRVDLDIKGLPLDVALEVARVLARHRKPDAPRD